MDKQKARPRYPAIAFAAQKHRTLQERRRNFDLNSPSVRTLEDLNESQDHHPEPPDEPKDRIIRLTFNFDINQATFEEAQRLAADLQNAGDEIIDAWKMGMLPVGCEVSGIDPGSCEVFIK